MRYRSECLKQVLEVKETSRRAPYEPNKYDARHQQVIACADEPATQRAFAKWSIAFQVAKPQQFDDSVGYLGKPSDGPIRAARLPLNELHVLGTLRSFALL